MIETGTYNLIFILTKMDILSFQEKATVAIRKATSSRVIECLDSFVANGLCEELIKILEGFGQEELLRIELKPKE